MTETGASAGVTSVKPTARKRARISYLDLVRALAALLIVLTHFNNPRLADGGYVPTNFPFDIYVGGLDVSSFLIISGAAPTVTCRRSTNLKRFYRKCCFNIYPMLWTVWVFATLYFFVTTGGRPPNSTPTRSLIFTALGVDGLVANFQVCTAYFLGERFLGFILPYYPIFPTLLRVIDRLPVVASVVILTAYVATVIAMRCYFAGYPSAMILITRPPELAFGSYFVLYVRRVHWAVVLPTVAVLVVPVMLPEEIPEDMVTTLVGIPAFLILVVVGHYVAIQPVHVFVDLVAKYSYPIFLVHHVAIMVLFKKINVMGFASVQRYMMLVAICVAVFGLSVALMRITDHIVTFVTKAFKGMSWHPEVPEVRR